MQRLRTHQNGVTLVTLVVTIIVLLILAGVAINLTIGNNGLFSRAQNAVNKYKEAEENELEILKELENKIADRDNNNDDSNEDPPKEERILAEIAQPGDYVEYDAGETVFTMRSKEYNTKDYTGSWQVLYNNDERKLQIISAGDVTNGKKLSMGGKNGYQDCVSILNEFCAKFVNSDYAQSGRCVGSNPDNPKGSPTAYTAAAATDTRGLIVGMYAGDTTYQIDTNAMKNAKSQEESGIYSKGFVYWLASRQDTVWGDPLIRFYIRRADVEYTGYPEYDIVRGSSPANEDYEHYNAHGVRPVITLNENIKTNDGDGTASNPYKLVSTK